MEVLSQNSKQQILCYILKTTLLYPLQPQSPTKESPPSLKEHLEPQRCEHLCPRVKMQDQPLLHTDPPRQAMPVSVITETVPIEKDFIYDVTVLEEPEVIDEEFLPVKIELKEEKESQEIEEQMEDIIDPPTLEDVPEIFRDEGDKILVKEKEETNILEIKKEAMDTTGSIKITSDVFTVSVIKYLIRIDKEEFAFADDEKSALAIINSLANAEVKKLANPAVKVFRRDLHDGKEVQICTQTLGVVMNGRVSRNTVIDVIAVPKVFITMAEPVGVSIQTK